MITRNNNTVGSDQLARKYNRESRRINGYNTVVLRRKQGEKIEERLNILGTNKATV